MTAAEVFNIPELLEAILFELDMRSLLSSQAVNRAFEATIRGSDALREKLFFLPVPDEGQDDSELIANPMLGLLQYPVCRAKMEGSACRINQNKHEKTTKKLAFPAGLHLARIGGPDILHDPPGPGLLEHSLPCGSGSWQHMLLTQPPRAFLGRAHRARRRIKAIQFKSGLRAGELVEMFASMDQADQERR